MLTNHEFLIEVIQEIYPKVKSIEADCLQLFNKQFNPGRGPTGLTGTNELDWTVQLLRSSALLLDRIAMEHHL